MTLGSYKAISGTALPPGPWNGDGASASRFLKLFIERGSVSYVALRQADWAPIT